MVGAADMEQEKREGEAASQQPRSAEQQAKKQRCAQQTAAELQRQRKQAEQQQQQAQRAAQRAVQQQPLPQQQPEQQQEQEQQQSMGTEAEQPPQVAPAPPAHPPLEQDLFRLLYGAAQQPATAAAGLTTALVADFSSLMDTLSPAGQAAKEDRLRWLLQKGDMPAAARVMRTALDLALQLHAHADDRRQMGR